MVNRLGRVALGFDVGTSSVKASAISESGMVLSATSSPYPTSIPFEGGAEQNPDDWWDALRQAARALLSQLVAAGAEISPTNATIGLTGQMHTTVLLDEFGDVLHPAILWSDKRATSECQDLVETVPDFAEITGNRPMPAFTVAHLLWLRRHRGAEFARARLVLNPKDEIRRRLGAGIATEPSDASGTGLFDTRDDAWSTTIAHAVGLDLAMLPPVIPSHGVSGVVSGFGALEDDDVLGLLEGLSVVGGGGDQATQAVALGVVSPGQLGFSLGTSGTAFAAASSPRLGAFRHSYEGLWLALDSTHAAGLSMTWLASITRASVPELAATMAGPSDSPLFLPYLQGHRDTIDSANDGVPGAILGLDAHHTSDHLAYAAMEGVAFELARLGESVRGIDERPHSDHQMLTTEVHLGGGGGRSARWRSIIASAVGLPVVYSDRDSAFGAAVIASEAADWTDAFRSSERVSRERSSPDPQIAAIMRARRTRFDVASRSLGDAPRPS